MGLIKKCDRCGREIIFSHADIDFGWFDKRRLCFKCSLDLRGFMECGERKDE